MRARFVESVGGCETVTVLDLRPDVSTWYVLVRVRVHDAPEHKSRKGILTVTREHRVVGVPLGYFFL